MTTLLDLLKSKIPKSKLQFAPRSFDLIGSMAIVEIKDEVKKYEKQIANAIMQLHKPIRTVVKKSSAMKGEYRVRRVKIIAGGKSTETIYREHNVAMRFDVAKTYFSVRLSHERERVAALVKNKENVLVMFAGVGPFALVIAKKHPKANVIGIEKNPAAAKYFEENIKLNKLQNCKAIRGDVRKVIAIGSWPLASGQKLKANSQRLISWADRILMPLPKSAENFLDVAFKAAKNNCVIHFYNFGADENVFEQVREKINKAAKKCNVKIKILNEKIVRPYAPHIVQVCIDFKVNKN
ncbi:class I SAM-dependent methyltransferase family protein [Candidatus Micrarchaeota archaeon]|nr:class I SAM-dependent methyltransferase family protein [Candidatus Micrarchaeota archaeon]